VLLNHNHKQINNNNLQEKTMTNAATTTAPAPDNMEGKTGTAFTASQLITMACHGVVNTLFTAPSPKPDWFDDLDAKLTDAKNVANEWINTLGPKVTSGIPLQVINYGPTYDAVSQQIQVLVKANPTASGKDDPTVIQIKELVSLALVPGVETVIKDVDTTSDELEAWGKKLQAAHDALATGATSIQALETTLESDIKKITNAIKNLNTTIDGENKAIAYSAAAIGIGVFALIVEVALAPETGGASLLVGGAIGVAGIVGGAATWGVMQGKINKQFDEIAKDQQQMDDDNRQIIALQGLAMASNGAVSNLSLASSSLSKLRTQWAVFQGELNGVVAKLEKAEESISVIVQGVFTTAAQAEWVKTTETANALANRKISVEVKTFPMEQKKSA
jgi:hypothetical protein